MHRPCALGRPTLPRRVLLHAHCRLRHPRCGLLRRRDAWASRPEPCRRGQQTEAPPQPQDSRARNPASAGVPIAPARAGNVAPVSPGRPAVVPASAPAPSREPARIPTRPPPLPNGRWTARTEPVRSGPDATGGAARGQCRRAGSAGAQRSGPAVVVRRWPCRCRRRGSSPRAAFRCRNPTVPAPASPLPAPAPRARPLRQAPARRRAGAGAVVPAQAEGRAAPAQHPKEAKEAPAPAATSVTPGAPK